jgi:PAS domain S-box-containing protein
MRRRLPGSLSILTLATLAGWACLGVARGADAATSNVLMLCSQRPDLPAVRLIEEGLREELGAATSPRVEWFSEYFDFGRFSTADHEAALARYLRERYADHRIDLVLPMEGQALAFALRHRDELFPGLPIVFVVLDPHDVDATNLPPDVTGVAARLDFARTVGLALALQPDAREIVAVGGTSTLDTNVMHEAARVLDRLTDRIRWRAITPSSLGDIMTEVSRVPPGDIVLLTSLIRDGEGHARSNPEVARDLVPASRAPVYGVAGSLIDTGIVGGALIDFADLGRRAGTVALKRLHAEHVSYGAPETVARSELIVDWRALSHWGLSESRVPSEAIVRFKPPTLWEAHGSGILGIVLVCAAQSIMIAVLFAQRTRRRRVDDSLRESEERMSLAAESVNLGVWEWDVVRDEFWMTAQSRDLLGLEADEEATSARMLARVHSEDRDMIERAVREALREDRSFEAECRLAPANGREGWIGIVGRVQHTASGTPSRMRGVCIDITARKQAEREAHQRRDELTHISRVAMLGELSASTAHELNQPLTAILSNAQAALRFLDRDVADVDEVREIIKDIVADDQRAAEVIKRLRALFRRDAARHESLDVNQIARDALRLAHGDIVTRDVSVTLDLVSGLPAVVGDRVQLQQVLLNLILNACDAVADNAPGDRDVTVRTERADGAGVQISVRDRGHGIEAKQLERVFEPFVTTKAQGIGLGLSISRSIVVAHGGRLWAENDGDRGMCFTIELPQEGAAALLTDPTG